MPAIKAISLKQPWANLVADGRKWIETRRWSTKYRGPLLIVSSKKPPIRPAGFAVAIAELVECRPMVLRDQLGACCDLYPNAKAWALANVRKLVPFPVRGYPGLYDVEEPATVLGISEWLSRYIAVS